MSAEDINISHKIKSNGVGTILVKFQSHKAKSRLYKARTKLKNLRLTDIFPDVLMATRVAAGTGRIFINRHLKIPRFSRTGTASAILNSFNDHVIVSFP